MGALLKSKYLPSPANLTVWWNFGSMLGVALVVQLVTGLMLAMHYTPEVSMAFMSVMHITRDVNLGWLLRSVHANMASLYFLCLFCHIGRGIYFGSYYWQATWGSGVVLLLLSMMTAFLGYVLPWGQMSYWGATVITSMAGAIPVVGPNVVLWLWGGFSVASPTLSRFFVLHFLTPFLIAALVTLHLALLHTTGSNNPLGVISEANKIPFTPYFTAKDVVGFLGLAGALCVLVFWAPQFFLDPVNFIIADPLNTPPHIQPEWYFLFAYTILRAIPNKAGGVLALVLSILILFHLSFTVASCPRAGSHSFASRALFWYGIVLSFIMLTWVGARPAEPPFSGIGLFFTVLYFLSFFTYPLSRFKGGLNGSRLS